MIDVEGTHRTGSNQYSIAQSVSCLSSAALMMDVVVRVKDGWSSDGSRMFDILLLNAG
jgi:hypothetical protein